MTDPPVREVSSEEGFSTSLSLLQRARSNDAAAWLRLAELYSPLIDKWCRSVNLRPEDMEDVRQEVFLAVSTNISKFEKNAERGSFRGWLRTIARSKIADHWRKSPVYLSPLGGSDAMDWLSKIPEEAVDEAIVTTEEEEAGLVYRRALGLIATDFEESSWNAFWRVVVEEKRPADVASELGLTINAVYLAKSRVLARLRSEFGDMLES